MAAGQVIGCPRPDQIDAVGQGFTQLARHPAFQNAVGAIDGCHIRIKPKRSSQQKDDYFNYSYIAYKCRQFVIEQASFLIFLWATQDLFTPVLLKQQCTAMLSILHLLTFFKVIVGIHVLISPFKFSHH